MIRYTIGFLCAGLLAGAATPVAGAETNAPSAKPADRLAALFGDPVVAKGKGFEVKRSQLDASVITFKGAMAARGQTVSPLEMERLEPQLLEELIRLRLLLTIATDADREKGKELGEQRIKAEIERAGSEENVARQAKAIGRTFESWKAEIIDAAIARTILDREIKVTVTDDDVKKFYDENPARFEQPEQVRISHILFATLDLNTRLPLPEAQKETKRKLAEEVVKRARAGEDFVKLVKEFSEDASVKDSGGEITFDRGSRQLPPEFVAAAFSLSENQISDVITTVVGYHVVKMLEKTPAKMIELAKVSDRVKEVLTQQAIQERLPDYFEKLMKEANVEILDAKLKLPERDTAATAKPGDKK